MNKFKIIIEQLRSHAPFTLFGALVGTAFGLAFKNIGHETSHILFEIFHPAHVFLSALATSAMYQKFMQHRKPSFMSLIILIFVGLVGSIGVATLSDSIIPFYGQKLLGLEHLHLHVGFIEAWMIVIPSALIGIALAYIKPSIKSSHTAHVFVSTWASLFHMMMALDGAFSLVTMIGVFFFLFFAVWLPCCLSDIVFPLLFLGKVETCSHSKPH